MVKISGELCHALDKSKREQLSPQPAFLAEIKAPSLGGASGSAGQRIVSISAGCVELLNQLAHAKALDEIKPGHFKSYSAALAQCRSADSRPTVTQSLAESQAWEAEVLNHQAGTFNQMAGALIAIDFAHHYLGHYKKYSAQLSDASGQPVPICARLTEKEWREAVMKGARNALDCGLGVEGMRCLLSAFDQMQPRPEWSVWFVHPKANIRKLDRDLDTLERDFFLVEK